jgi:hypothetical protein
VLNFEVLLAGNVIDGSQSVGYLIPKFMIFLTSSHLTRKPAFVLFALLTFTDVSNVPAEYRAEKTRVVLGTVKSSLKVTQLVCVAVKLKIVSC